MKLILLISLNCKIFLRRYLFVIEINNQNPSMNKNRRSIFNTILIELHILYETHYMNSGLYNFDQIKYINLFICLLNDIFLYR